MRISLLLAEDEAATRSLMTELLRDWPGGELSLVAAASPEEALAAAEERAFTIALVDLHYETSKSDGFALLEALRKKDSRMELIVLSSANTFAAVQQALRAGANDYLAKGFGRGELYHVLDRALERRRWRQMEGRLKQENGPVLAMAGTSSAMKSMAVNLRKFGPSAAPVLIFGETGTGKELAARGLHAYGADPAASFVAVNCAAIPASTVDSFFFGHERGAFTGADRARAGVFEEAEGGTLFLDEVNSLPPEMQGRLLRVLEQKEIRRLGGSRVVPVHFRLLAATNGDLDELVKSGSFREDLLYRLNTLQLKLPPLRERLEDLPDLAKLFQPDRKISRELWDLWNSYAWPGNVREFRNLLLAMDAMAEPGEMLSAEHIPEHLLRKFSDPPNDQSEIPDDLSSFAGAQAERETDSYGGPTGAQVEI
ncbi:MAG: sigma-54-dependent transcriptional regulator [Bacteriovoracia bacterium]